MIIELNEQERQTLLAALNLLVKSASNALAAASEVLPLASKIQSASANDAPQ